MVETAVEQRVLLFLSSVSHQNGVVQYTVDSIYNPPHLRWELIPRPNKRESADSEGTDLCFNLSPVRSDEFFLESWSLTGRAP